MKLNSKLTEMNEIQLKLTDIELTQNSQEVNETQLKTQKINQTEI